MSDEFQTLGSALRDVARGRSEPIIAPDEARRLLDRINEVGFEGLKEPTPLPVLIDLPATSAVLSELEAARMTLSARISGNAGRRMVAAAQAELSRQETRYADAIRRDTLMMSRPPGCWCLGYGGHGSSYLPMPTGETYTGHDGVERPSIVEREVLTEHCTACEEGKERAEDDAALRQEYAEIRRKQAIIRRFGDAKLPKEYQTYRWQDHPDREKVERVAAWMLDPKKEPDAHHWLLLYGLGGRGKTTIMAGLAVELAASGKSVLFRTMPDLLSDIRATFGKAEKTEELRQLLYGVTWLFLDDVGTEVPKDWVGEFLYQLLNHRHNEHMPTVLSTNLGIRALGEHVGERIFGRIKRMAEPIYFDGEDLRDRPHG